MPKGYLASSSEITINGTDATTHTASIAPAGVSRRALAYRPIKARESHTRQYLALPPLNVVNAFPTNSQVSTGDPTDSRNSFTTAYRTQGTKDTAAVMAAAAKPPNRRRHS